jgi:Fe-S cluster biogenesis protein NfuA
MTVQVSPDSSTESVIFERIVGVLREKVLPLVVADGGELYLVGVSGNEVKVHLAGTCAGCPGASMTERHLLTPAIRSVLPLAIVQVATGFRVPAVATRVSFSDA